MTRLLLWLLALVSFSTLADRMIWLSDASSEADKTITLDEQSRDLILQGMDDITFDVEATTTERALKRLQQEPNVCIGDLIVTPERQQFSLASQVPQVIVPGLKLWVHRSSLADTFWDTAADMHSIDTLMLTFPDLRMAVMQGRSYGHHLDQLFETALWKDRIWHRPSSDMGEGVLAMLLSKRVEAIFEYPNVFHTLSQGQPHAFSIRPITIAETPEYIAGHVLCSKTPQGAKAIEAISARLLQMAREKSYLNLILGWFDESLHAAYIKHYNQVYNTQFSAETVVD